jgi:hypothetical protein
LCERPKIRERQKARLDRNRRDVVLQNEREISAGLVELLKLERPVAERFQALDHEQFNPISRYPTRYSKNGFRGAFRAKEKITAKPQQVVVWTFAESARR